MQKLGSNYIYIWRSSNNFSKCGRLYDSGKKGWVEVELDLHPQICS